MTPGGSSGGEGALVAMRGSPLGVGTDIGGYVHRFTNAASTLLTLSNFPCMSMTLSADPTGDCDTPDDVIFVLLSSQLAPDSERVLRALHSPAFVRAPTVLQRRERAGGPGERLVRARSHGQLP